jgi:hypothetical protein
MHAAIGGTLKEALARELEHQLTLFDSGEVREALLRKSKSVR